MSKVTINLLPQDILLKRQQGAKLAVLSKMSIVLLITLIFCASVTIALKLSQTFQLQALNQELGQSQSKLSSLESVESNIQIIKVRLQSIDTLSAGDNKLKDMLNLVLLSVPPGITVVDFSVTKLGVLNITMESDSLSNLEGFFTNINSIDQNQAIVKSIDLEGFSLGKDAIFRMGLKINSN